MKTARNLIHHLLEDDRVRSQVIEGREVYSPVDLVALLADCADAHAEWDELKQAEPGLSRSCVLADLGDEPQEMLDLRGVMRLILAIDSSKAEKLRNWMTDVAARHLEEEADPELAIGRLRHGYLAQGRMRSWIDQRLRSISARHEIVGEWYKRGIKDSEQFRLLTNALMESTFGMDVNAFRASKGYVRNLRDHLTDLELSLLSLAETTAASLHRQSNSTDMEILKRDVQDAGRIIAQTRHQIMEAVVQRPEAA